MMARAPLLAAALVAGGTAFAAEGGAVRSGEHDGFTRLVVQIDPATEWSLETAGDRARLTFPGRRLGLDASRVFDRIPATRVTSVTAAEIGDATVLEVALGCDCRVSASFVGGRYLALDVADHDAARVAGGVDGAFLSAVEGAIAQAERETNAVASAEEILIRQLERAAGQGVIELRSELPAADGPEMAPDARPSAPTAPAGEVAESAEPPSSAPQQDASVEIAALLDHDQIRARTVYDEAGRSSANTAEAAAPEAVCIEAVAFEVSAWSDGAPMAEQVAALRRRIVVEFDAADPETILDLARLYLHFGFGLEAEGTLGAFGQSDPDATLLLDLARAMEGRPVKAGGPLDVDAECPGAHALWIALGGAGPVYRDGPTFNAVAGAFADLPPNLRALLGPRLADSLVTEDQPAAARRIMSITERSGLASGPDARLVAARLMSVDGDARGAIAALTRLIAENAPNATDALVAAVEFGLGENLSIPETLITELRASAVQFRGTEAEPGLKSLLARALAQNGETAAALEIARALEAERPDAAGLRLKILAAATPDRVGPAEFAEAALVELDAVADDPATDPARRSIARRLLELGLPEAALEAALPARLRGDPEARRIVAESHLELGRPEAALSALGDLDGVFDAGLRARALAARGDYDAAVSLLDAEGFGLQADDYAWASGDWRRALQAADDPRRAAMAAFMTAREADGRGPDAAPLEPQSAFAAPLPDLGRPSLRSAEELLANGEAIGAFVLEMLEDPSTPTPGE